MFLFHFHFVAEITLLADASPSSTLWLRSYEKGVVKALDFDGLLDSRNGRVSQPHSFCISPGQTTGFLFRLFLNGNVISRPQYGH